MCSTLWYSTHIVTNLQSQGHDIQEYKINITSNWSFQAIRVYCELKLAFCDKNLDNVCTNYIMCAKMSLLWVQISILWAQIGILWAQISILLAENSILWTWISILWAQIRYLKHSLAFFGPKLAFCGQKIVFCEQKIDIMGTN